MAGPDGLRVIAKEIAEPEVLVFTEILTTLEQQPAGLLQDWGPRASCYSFRGSGDAPHIAYRAGLTVGAAVCRRNADAAARDWRPSGTNG